MLQACPARGGPGRELPQALHWPRGHRQEARGNGTGRLLVAEGLARCQQVWPGRAVRISAQAHLQRFTAALGLWRCRTNTSKMTSPHRNAVDPTRGAGLNGRAARVPQLVTPQCARKCFWLKTLYRRFRHVCPDSSPLPSSPFAQKSARCWGSNNWRGSPSSSPASAPNLIWWPLTGGYRKTPCCRWGGYLLRHRTDLRRAGTHPA